MKTTLKLSIASLLTTLLLTGCSLRPTDNNPYHPAERLEQPPKSESAESTNDQPPSIHVTEPLAATKKPIPPSTAPNIKMRLTYTVSEGELLWTIAKRPDVYGDPLLWPLLYQANRDQIKDPRKVYAGQTLSIPRNISENEREKARQFAKNSDFFSRE